MKKVSLLLVAFAILTGCSMGINQSAVMINGKPYLVEKEVRNFLYIKSYSYKPRYTNLEEKDPDVEIAKDYLNQMANRCKTKYKGDLQKSAECLLNSIQ